MNNWIGIGNLTRDPELKYSTGERQTAVCTFTIAINEGYGDKQDTQFVNVKAFGSQAENCHKYLNRGRKVAVQGRLKTGYKDRDGSTKYYTEILASNVEFLSQQTETPKQEVMEGFSRLQEEVPF